MRRGRRLAIGPVVAVLLLVILAVGSSLLVHYAVLRMGERSRHAGKTMEHVLKVDAASFDASTLSVRVWVRNLGRGPALIDRAYIRYSNGMIDSATVGPVRVDPLSTAEIQVFLPRVLSVENLKLVGPGCELEVPHSWRLPDEWAFAVDSGSWTSGGGFMVALPNGKLIVGGNYGSASWIVQVDPSYPKSDWRIEIAPATDSLTLTGLLPLNGYLFLYGYWFNSSNFVDYPFYALLDPANASLIYARLINVTDDSAATEALLGPGGLVYLFGGLRGTGSIGRLDWFVAAVDPATGSLLWVDVIGTTVDDAEPKVLDLGGGHVLLIGRSDSWGYYFYPVIAMVRYDLENRTIVWSSEIHAFRGDWSFNVDVAAAALGRNGLAYVLFSFSDGSLPLYTVQYYLAVVDPASGSLIDLRLLSGTYDEQTSVHRIGLIPVDNGLYYVHLMDGGPAQWLNVTFIDYGLTVEWTSTMPMPISYYTPSASLERLGDYVYLQVDYADSVSPAEVVVYKLEATAPNAEFNLSCTGLSASIYPTRPISLTASGDGVQSSITPSTASPTFNTIDLAVTLNTGQPWTCTALSSK